MRNRDHRKLANRFKDAKDPFPRGYPAPCAGGIASKARTISIGAGAFRFIITRRWRRRTSGCATGFGWDKSEPSFNDETPALSGTDASPEKVWRVGSENKFLATPDQRERDSGLVAVQVVACERAKAGVH
ncbi:MAG: hypothetical protein WCN98_10845 [Verrucomicrobiaceae bacterium]